MEPVYTSEVGEEPEPSQCSFKSITPQDQLRKHDSPNFSCCCTNETDDIWRGGRLQATARMRWLRSTLKLARRLPGEHRVDIRPGQYTRRGGGGWRRPTTQQHDDLLLCTRGNRREHPQNERQRANSCAGFRPDCQKHNP